MNQKYFSAEKIYARLAKQHKKKMAEYTLGDIVGMCAEIEIEVIGDSYEYERIENYEMEVIDGKALLPCNIYRILDVMSNNTRIFDFHNNGIFLSFSENANIVPSNGSIVTMNYMGIPLCPDTGYPLFLRGHEQALYWGCLFRIYEEDGISGNMNYNSWNDIQLRYETQLSAAKGGFRHMDRNSMKQFTAIVTNAIQKANKLPTNL